MHLSISPFDFVVEASQIIGIACTPKVITGLWTIKTDVSTASERILAGIAREWSGSRTGSHSSTQRGGEDVLVQGNRLDHMIPNATVQD